MPETYGNRSLTKPSMPRQSNDTQNEMIRYETILQINIQYNIYCNNLVSLSCCMLTSIQTRQTQVFWGKVLGLNNYQLVSEVKLKFNVFCINTSLQSYHKSNL